MQYPLRLKPRGLSQLIYMHPINLFSSEQVPINFILLDFIYFVVFSSIIMMADTGDQDIDMLPNGEVIL